MRARCRGCTAPTVIATAGGSDGSLASASYVPPKSSSAPSPERTIFKPSALICAADGGIGSRGDWAGGGRACTTLRLMRYMGVAARIVVTSKVSRCQITCPVARRAWAAVQCWPRTRVRYACLFNGIQPFLDGVLNAMVLKAQKGGHLGIRAQRGWRGGETARQMNAMANARGLADAQPVLQT
jgi:hypothetical protein